MTIPFTEKIQFSNGKAISLFQGKRGDGMPIYTYIRMDRQQYQKLQDDLGKKANLKLENYGEVLISGEGRPTPQEMEYMEREHGFSHKKIRFQTDER